MKRSRTFLVLLLGSLLASPAAEVQACTTFCMTRGPQSFFGKNYDWMVPDGLVMVNKRGVAKTSSIGPEEGRPAKYEKSLRFREANKGDAAALHGRGSLQRFARAAERADRFAATKAEDPVGYAFEALADVAQG